MLSSRGPQQMWRAVSERAGYSVLGVVQRQLDAAPVIEGDATQSARNCPYLIWPRISPPGLAGKVCTFT